MCNAELALLTATAHIEHDNMLQLRFQKQK
jgi:hypothetical protein